jgi:hypothetical protein
MSRSARMALIAAVTFAGMRVIMADDAIELEEKINPFDDKPPSDLLAVSLARCIEVPCSYYYDWEVDPAVLSRPVADTMPTQAGVRSNARHRTMTTLAAGADPQVPGTCKEKRSSA